MRRKLLISCISMGLGILIWIYKSPVIIVILIILGGFLLYCTRKNPITLKNMSIIFCCILIGMIRTCICDFQHGNLEEYQTEGKTIAEVYKISKADEEKYKLECLVISVDGKSLNERAVINYYKNLEDYPTYIGATISFYGQLQLPQPAKNPRTFDYKRHLRSQDIYFVASVQTFDVVPTDKSLVNKGKSFIIGQREKFLNGLNCKEETKNFIRGVIFGDKSQLDEEIYQDFQSNGTAHILAVSGLHVGILYGIYNWILKKHNRKIITAMFLLVLFGYGTLTLWSVSVTRAICLVTLVAIGNLLDRRYDLTTALGLIALVLMVKNPYIIQSVGFQMSFLAVASIGFVAPVLERKLPKGVSVAVAVQMGMIPYTAYVFNYVPLIGIICNIPIIFLVSILVPLGLGSFVLSFILGDTLLATPANTLLVATSDLLIKTNAGLSQDGLFSVDVVSPKLWIVVLIYVLIFYLTSEDFIVRFLRKDKEGLTRIFVAILTVVLMSGIVGGSDFDKAFLVFVDVGQGDCIHLSLENDQDLLVDGGGTINYNVGKNTLKPYLLKNGNSNVDLAMATHLHTDHYLGLTQLAECFDVKRILTKGKTGDRITVDENCYIDIIWPMEQNPEIDDENLNSLIFKINYKGYTVLVTGDITAEGEKCLIDNYKGTEVLKCNVLKIGHHGSKYSSTDEFLEAVDPEVAVISVGKNNYGHPSDEVIEKLDKKGIMVFRTDLDGAVGLIERKGKISICTQDKR